MQTMSFMPELTSFLEANNCIYTVRKYRMVEADVEIEGIGICHRKPLGVIKKELDLDPYVESSGFATTRDWWNKIKYFIPDSLDTKYLYKVTVGGKES